MNDQLIVVGVVLFALALSFVLFGRKTPSRHRPSPARVPQLARVEEAAAAKKHSSHPPAKKHSSHPPAKKHSSRPPAPSDDIEEAADVTEVPAPAAAEESAG